MKKYQLEHFIPREGFDEKLNRKGIGTRYSFDLSYSAGPKIKQFKETYDKAYTPTKYYPKLSRFAKELNDKSFGFELESADGYIPEQKCFKNGLIP